ncbi:MAG: hypothetical protein NC206_03205 [Bacteroides sp.]|nr:hypothetical protein [Roseburia sp.]MCM1346072.1 hypothetical protein [Bacteroides sp.]MCM1421339.1 hypothetical protein [Bacteroides sp.]
MYATAEKTIFVVDNYIGLKTLVLLKDVPANVNVVVFSGNIGNRLHQAEFNDFCRAYFNVTISLQTSGEYSTTDILSLITKWLMNRFAIVVLHRKMEVIKLRQLQQLLMNPLTIQL